MKYLVFISDTAPFPTVDTDPSTGILAALSENGIKGTVVPFTDLTLAGYPDSIFSADEEKEEAVAADEADESHDEAFPEERAEVTEEETAEEPIKTEEAPAEADESPMPFVDKWNIFAYALSDSDEVLNTLASLSVTGKKVDSLSALPLVCDGALAYYHLTEEMSGEDFEKSLAALLSSALSEDDVRVLAIGKEEDGVRPYLLAAVDKPCENAEDVVPEPIDTEENTKTEECGEPEEKNETEQEEAADLLTPDEESQEPLFPALAPNALVKEPSLLLSALLDVIPEKDATEDTQPTAEETATEKEEKTPLSHLIFEWLELFAFSLAAVLIVMTFFFRHSPVSGTSMLPTLNNGDILLISRLEYTPERGDVVIVQSEKDDLRRPLVKRVIALGGDTIRINFETWEIAVNGEVIDEPYIDKLPIPMEVYGTAMFLLRVDDELPIYEGTVPEGKLFILGDNRNNSKDSRAIGFVDEREIIGDVRYRLFPLDQAGEVD